MTDFETPELIIPIQASHLRDALAIARENMLGFQQSELDWLRTNNQVLRQQVGNLFDGIRKLRGMTDGNAFLAGSALGNRAVRLCLGETGDYNVVAANFQKNSMADLTTARERGDSPLGAMWNSERVLAQLFSDQDLVAAFMDIRHDTARDAAAFTIGFYCLAEIPEIV